MHLLEIRDESISLPDEVLLRPYFEDGSCRKISLGPHPPRDLWFDHEAKQQPK